MAEVKQIYSQLAKIQKEIKPIAKNSTVNNQYKARSVDDIYNVLSAIFERNEVMILPKIVDKEYQDFTVLKNGKEGKVFKVYYVVEFTFLSLLDGSIVSCSMAGEGADTQDKATGKAMSNAYKYALAEAFMIPFEGIKDSDMYEHEDITSEKDYKQAIEKLQKAQTIEGLQNEFRSIWVSLKNDQKGREVVLPIYNQCKELFQVAT